MVTNPKAIEPEPTRAQRARSKFVELAFMRPVQRLVLYTVVISAISPGVDLLVLAYVAVVLLVATEGF